MASSASPEALDLPHSHSSLPCSAALHPRGRIFQASPVTQMIPEIDEHRCAIRAAVSKKRYGNARLNRLEICKMYVTQSQKLRLQSCSQSCINQTSVGNASSDQLLRIFGGGPSDDDLMLIGEHGCCRVSIPLRSSFDAGCIAGHPLRQPQGGTAGHGRRPMPSFRSAKKRTVFLLEKITGMIRCRFILCALHFSMSSQMSWQVSGATNLV